MINGKRERKKERKEIKSMNREKIKIKKKSRKGIKRFKK